MKYKVIRVVGTVVMLLFACVQSAIILWNYGRTGMGIYDPFHDLGKFSWSIIVGTDWLGWALCTLWFFLLVISWIQYFVAMERHQCLRTTLSGKQGFFHVFFTVFNISLIVGGMFLLVKVGDEYDMRYGYDRLMRVLEVAVLVYTPWALSVMIGNMNRGKVVYKSESDNHNASGNKVWHWIVSCIFFISLAAYAFDGWYNWRNDFHKGSTSQCVNGKCGDLDCICSDK